MTAHGGQTGQPDNNQLTGTAQADVHLGVDGCIGGPGPGMADFGRRYARHDGDGLELSVLGLVAGVDPLAPALKLPGFGRIGW
jgi:hypothetical protein